MKRQYKYTELAPGTADHLSRVVGRCHVGDSPKKVIQYVLSVFKKGTMKKCSPHMRRQIWRHVLLQHHANRLDYINIVTGRI